MARLSLVLAHCDHRHPARRLIYENDAFDLNITQVNVSDLAHRVAIGHEGGFAQKKLDFIYNYLQY